MSSRTVVSRIHSISAADLSVLVIVNSLTFHWNWFWLYLDYLNNLSLQLWAESEFYKYFFLLKIFLAYFLFLSLGSIESSNIPISGFLFFYYFHHIATLLFAFGNNFAGIASSSFHTKLIGLFP